MAKRVRLRAGDLAVTLAPAVGGSIASFAYRDRPVMRPAPPTLTHPLDGACFPLVPYCNRIRNGSFSFRGRTVELAPNMAGDASPLHGQGWLSAWTVAKADETTAELRFAHRAGEWPWSYQAVQLFRLEPSGLSIRLGCRNLSDSPMPCGLGQHPYFPCGAATIIDTDVDVVWSIDDRVLPVERLPAEGRFNLRNRSVCAQDIDHGFGGWSGSALIHSPELPFSIRIESGEADFFQLYSPASGGIFVAEPVTHANAALNAPERDWPELGLRILGPGEEMVLNSRFVVTALSSEG
jgi:aldose 1-epimerase